MKLTVLTDNNTFIDQYYLGEPAVSYYIQEDGLNVLFDTGYSDVFIRNAKKMGIDLSLIDTLVLSHGHNDHSGGLKYLKEINNHFVLLCHPETFEYKEDENGKRLEPMELAYIDVPDEFSGAVIQKLSERKGELVAMSSGKQNGTTRLEFNIPSRGLIGYRGDFMTDTKGNGIINTIFNGYAPYKGDLSFRKQGSIIAFESGEAITYGLFNAQERGQLFIGPGEKVYSGMIIGQCGKPEDVEVNVCKTKHLTNTRSSGADDALKLVPKKIMSLEQCIEFIDSDELLEVTPENLRIRKKILDPTLRKRASFKKNQ